MFNIVLTTKSNKRKVIENFIRSRGIVNFVISDDSQELYDALLTDTCNVHIFDYHMDMSIINILRDLRDNASRITVYVTSTEHATPYLSLTDYVYVLPDTMDPTLYFWDSEACSAKNVMAFKASNMEAVKIINPDKNGATKHLTLDLSLQDVPLKYRTVDGRTVQKKCPQLVVSAKAKAIDLTSILKTRDQSEVYNRRQRNLEDLPDGPIDEPEDIEEIPVAKPIKESKSKPVKEPKPVKPKPVKEVKPKPEKPDQSSAEKQGNGFASFFAKIKAKPEEPEEIDTSLAEETEEIETTAEETTIEEVVEVAAEPEKSVEETKSEPESEKEKKEPQEYVSFGGFTAGTGGRTSGVKRRKMTISFTCRTVAEYCLENKYISHEDHDKLMLTIKSTRDASRDAQFGDEALKQGFITEEQLIKAISAVNGMEVLPWSAVENLDLDFAFFTIDKCKTFRFFKVADSSLSGSEKDTVQLIVSASISNLNSEVKRLFDSPRIRYTLDSVITRKLDEWEAHK